LGCLVSGIEIQNFQTFFFKKVIFMVFKHLIFEQPKKKNSKKSKIKNNQLKILLELIALPGLL
jgi:hypothetical protein